MSVGISYLSDKRNLFLNSDKDRLEGSASCPVAESSAMKDPRGLPAKINDEVLFLYATNELNTNRFGHQIIKIV